MNADLRLKVLAECRAQHEAGKTPTLRSVREGIGGTGSFTDLSPLVKQFNETKDYIVPEDLMGLVTATGHEIWAQAQRKFESTLSSVQNANMASREQLESDFERLKVELDQAREDKSSQQQRIELLEKELQESRALPDKLLDRHDRELNELKLRISQLTEQADVAKTQHEADSAQIAELREKLAAAQSIASIGSHAELPPE